MARQNYKPKAAALRALMRNKDTAKRILEVFDAPAGSSRNKIAAKMLRTIERSYLGKTDGRGGLGYMRDGKGGPLDLFSSPSGVLPSISIDPRTGTASVQQPTGEQPVPGSTVPPEQQIPTTPTMLSRGIDHLATRPISETRLGAAATGATTRLGQYAQQVGETARLGYETAKDLPAQFGEQVMMPFAAGAIDVLQSPVTAASWVGQFLSGAPGSPLPTFGGARPIQVGEAYSPRTNLLLPPGAEALPAGSPPSTTTSVTEGRTEPFTQFDADNVFQGCIDSGGSIESCLFQTEADTGFKPSYGLVSSYSSAEGVQAVEGEIVEGMPSSGIPGSTNYASSYGPSDVWAMVEKALTGTGGEDIQAWFSDLEVSNPDVAGAGDTFNAAFVLGLSSGQDIYNATKLANYAAGVVVGKPGVETVSRKELQKALMEKDKL